MRIDLTLLGELAQRLRSLHHADDPLVLANVWDPGTAKAVEAAGLPALATSSGAVSRARGFEDHEQMPVDVAFAAVAEIARSVSLPVSGDMESGYGLAPDEFVERLVGAGVVGCNFEDTDHSRPGQIRDAEEQAERIAGLRAAAQRLGVGIVVNARVDTFLLQLGSMDEQLAEAVRRGRLYLDAGADCVYPIGLSDDALIGAMVEETPGPVNILLRPGTPDLGRLKELGVRRVSVASSLYRRAMKAFDEGLKELTSAS